MAKVKEKGKRANVEPNDLQERSAVFCLFTCPKECSAGSPLPSAHCSPHFCFASKTQTSYKTASCRPVALTVRASDSKSGGWGFESLLACQENQGVSWKAVCFFSVVRLFWYKIGTRFRCLAGKGPFFPALKRLQFSPCSQAG